MELSLRERTHRTMQAELSEAVLDVLIDRGFESCTVEDLAQAVGISRATFFRYFGSKEDAVLRGVLTSSAATDPATVLADLPPDASADPWTLLRAAFAPQADEVDADPDRMRARLGLIRSVPSVSARLALRRREQLDDLTAALDARIGDRATARVRAAAALAVVAVCWEEWASRRTGRLGTALDDAFSRLSG